MVLHRAAPQQLVCKCSRDVMPQPRMYHLDSAVVQLVHCCMVLSAIVPHSIELVCTRPSLLHAIAVMHDYNNSSSVMPKPTRDSVEYSYIQQCSAAGFACSKPLSFGKAAVSVTSASTHSCVSVIVKTVSIRHYEQLAHSYDLFLMRGQTNGQLNCARRQGRYGKLLTQTLCSSW
jgi:hypothetical protein